jgi:hypothetical protein
MSDTQAENTNTTSTNTTPTQQAVTSTTVQGTESSVGSTTAVGEAQNTQPVEKSFSEQIPEEYRNEASLTNVKDMNALVKGYVHAQKELGSRVRVPGPDASPEVKAEFNKRMEAAGYITAPDLNDPAQKDAIFNKLGRPETPDGYDATIPEELGAIVNEGQLKTYRELAHKVGLSKEQAKALLEFDVNRTMEQMENSAGVAKETLKGEWGDAFDQRLTLSKDALKHFEAKYPDAVAAIKNGPAGNNPVVLMMAAELGRMYKESGIIVGNRSVSYGLTPTEAKARINEVMTNNSHPYHKDSDPKHWAAVEEVEQLYKAAYPEQGQSG